MACYMAGNLTFEAKLAETLKYTQINIIRDIFVFMKT